MKKSWMLSFVGALLAAGSLAMSARAQSTNVVYAAEYNQSTNRFGTIDLLNGNFTKISSFGNALINDIAYCPTNGTLYGISNTATLVTFNRTNGTITKIGNVTGGIESLAFRPSDGALFGATSSKLYSINPANGTSTLVGNYGTPPNLGTSGQNIRFANDGNLYVSNTSTNTDIYRINTASGAATWMGEAAGFPYLILMNSSSNMYGVYINLGTSTNPVPKLATFDLSSFVNGGTNANGSTHQVTVNLVGAGTNFPANFNFSGNVPQAVTNLTVPVSATGPSNLTVSAGNTAVFSTVASGTPPYGYVWLKNGSTISGQTGSSLTLANVTASDAATYSVIVSGAMGTVTNSATLTVTKANATVTLGSLSQTYDGSAKTATATTTPSGLTVNFTYNGSATVPTNAGSYTVVGTINDASYQGSATNTLAISKATATVTLGSLSQTYNGSAKAATATTAPGGLAVTFTYNGSATVPTGAGSYAVVGTINDANYQGSASGTLVVAQASASVTLGSLSQTYNGSARSATATTTPGGLAVTFTYNGSATVPTGAGSYAVVGTINDANYQGSASGTLVVAQASASVTLGSLSQTYNGSARSATATTTPGGLAVTFTYNGSATVPTGAGSYAVVGTINDANYQGSASGTLVVAQASASVTLGSLSQTYNGSARSATATTTPGGLAVTFTYNGSATVPTGAGSYAVVGTINDANYQGSASGTLVVAQASASVTLGSLSQTYNGSARSATATTTPGGLAVTFTYNGSATVPTGAGSYAVIGTINDANYQGNTTGTLVIAQASASVSLGGLSQTYDGSAKAATATTTPSGLTVDLTYNGSATVPTGAGSYAVIGTINDANYQGNATGTLVIAQASASVSLGGLSQTYDGSAKAATATTTPSGLTVDLTYNGSATVPTGAGSYAVVGTINDANYQGSASGTLVVAQASASVSLGGLSQTYDGSAKAATATTTPSGLTVDLTYNGSATVPTGAGSYAVVGTINDANYQGNATGTLVVAQASVSVTLDNLNQTYDGSAKAATATTSPNGLAVSFTYDDSATVPTNAGSYTVVSTINDANYQGSATNTLVIAQASASVTLDDLNQTYDGSAKAATATTTPNNLTVDFTYNGSGTVPTAAGSYVVIGTIDDTNYQGSATNTLVIAQASASVSLGGLSQTYDGSAKAATATTTPSGLTVDLTYNGSATVPTGAGSYAVVGTINDANYQGNATGTLVIGKATSSVSLNSLSQTYDGSAKAATATTTPSGLTVDLTYNGSATVPTGAGSYTVVGTINDANYQGNATGTLVIGKATSSVSLNSLSQTYDGSAKAATATTTPSGLTVDLTYNGSATVPTGAGSYTVVGTINDANYQGNATGTLVIGKATSSVSLNSLSQTYDGSAKAATATTTPSGLTVDLTYNGSATVPTSAGSYAVVGTINDANYQGNATGTLAINAATLTVTPLAVATAYNGTALDNAIYSDNTANYSITGFQNGETVSSAGVTLNGSMAFAGSTSTSVRNAGTYGLTVGTLALSSANNNYVMNFSNPTPNNYVINQAALTITAAANTKSYDGSTGAAATPTASGLQGSDSVTGLAETYDTKNVGSGKILSVSAYTVNDGNSGNNYTVSTVASTAGIVTPVTLTVTADAKTKISGMPNPSLTASYNGFVGGEDASVLSSPVVLNTTATTASGVGSYPITAGSAAAANYTIQYVDGTLQVIASPQLTGATVSVNGTQQFVVSWQTFPNETYQLECAANCRATTWTPVGSQVAGTGSMVSVTNSMSIPHCFYRVEVQ